MPRVSCKSLATRILLFLWCTVELTRFSHCIEADTTITTTAAAAAKKKNNKSNTTGVARTNATVAAVAVENAANWRPLPADSVCSGAFGMQNWTQRSTKVLEPIFNFHAIEDEQRVTLRNVNVGFGTTGTRDRFEVEKKKYRGCHYVVCNSKIHNGLASHNMKLIDCYKANSKTDNCRSKVWIDKLRDLTEEIVVSGLQAIADTPTDFIFRDLLDLAPRLEVVHTVRPPRDWVLDRVEKHSRNADYICDPRLSVNANVSTPFHIFQCIPGSQFIHDNIISMQDYMEITPTNAADYRSGSKKPPPAVEQRIQELIGFYVEYTQMTMNLVRSRPSIQSYLPICLFDDMK